MTAVRRRLPGRALACLYVDPRAVERVLGLVPIPEKPSDARFLAMLRRHLSAVDYAGAALAWGPDAVVVHAVETLDAGRVDAWLRRWAGDARPSRPSLRRVPPTAMAMACLHLDFTSMRDAIDQLTPEVDHPRLRNLELVLTGLLLGNDAREMLRAIGPGVVAFLDAPAEPAAGAPGQVGDRPARVGLFPLVVIVDIGGGGAGPSPSVLADSLQNALRTILALKAMDEKHGNGRASIATTSTAVASILTLDVPIPFAFAVDRAGGRLVLGTSAASVAHCLESSSDPGAGEQFRRWQAAAFPGFETFACVDLDALARLADRHRGRLASRLAARQDRPAAEVEDDLQNALALARLFRAAFAASRIEPDASAMHRRIGVILRGDGRSSDATP